MKVKNSYKNKSCLNEWQLAARAAPFGFGTGLWFAARFRVAQPVQRCAFAFFITSLSIVVALLVQGVGRQLGFGLIGIP